jgi:hypothetical protein
MAGTMQIAAHPHLFRPQELPTIAAERRRLQPATAA